MLLSLSPVQPSPAKTAPIHRLTPNCCMPLHITTTYDRLLPRLHLSQKSSWSDTTSDFEEECPPSPASSDSSLDEEEVNQRVSPYWPKYRTIFEARGFQLDRVRDVKEFYRRHPEANTSDLVLTMPSYLFAHGKDPLFDDDALCPDAGLPENLFRGARIFDGRKFVAKAVHLYSREYDVNRLLSRPPLRDDSMNHTIPVLDLIEFPEDKIAFIVMEEWSSQLITEESTCCLGLFLDALRQCIEHAAFMHKHNIAHLDISLRNLLTDYCGNYAYTDYELSRRFDGIHTPRVYGYRGTEVPPECERGESSDPYKIDVWALAVLVLRACKLTGHYVPELMGLIKPMLHERPEQRPPMQSVLRAFDNMMGMIGEGRLGAISCPSSH